VVYSQLGRFLIFKGNFKMAKSEDIIAHLENDLEMVKSRMRHLLRTDKEFLEEALIALTRNPPKIHVMVDHAERVINDFKQELIKLG